MLVFTVFIYISILCWLFIYDSIKKTHAYFLLFCTLSWYIKLFQWPLKYLLLMLKVLKYDMSYFIMKRFWTRCSAGAQIYTTAVEQSATLNSWGKYGHNIQAWAWYSSEFGLLLNSWQHKFLTQNECGLINLPIMVQYPKSK